MPQTSKQLGESDGYTRIDAAAFPTAADDATSRRIFALIHDHGDRHWVGLQAYDVQNTCIEGHRQT